MVALVVVIGGTAASAGERSALSLAGDRWAGVWQVGGQTVEGGKEGTFGALWIRRLTDPAEVMRARDEARNSSVLSACGTGAGGPLEHAPIYRASYAYGGGGRVLACAFSPGILHGIYVNNDRSVGYFIINRVPSTSPPEFTGLYSAPSTNPFFYNDLNLNWRGTRLSPPLGYRISGDAEHRAGVANGNPEGTRDGYRTTIQGQGTENNLGELYTTYSNLHSHRWEYPRVTWKVVSIQLRTAGTVKVLKLKLVLTRAIGFFPEGSCVKGSRGTVVAIDDQRLLENGKAKWHQTRDEILSSFPDCSVLSHRYTNANSASHDPFQGGFINGKLGGQLARVVVEPG